jgi:hypothetical protein
LRSPSTQGLLVHSTLAVTPDGLPVGLLAQEVWARPAVPPAQRPRKKATRTAEERESQKGFTSLAALSAGREAAPQTMLVSVGDREADRWVRVARDEYKYIHGLWAEVATAPVAGTREVLVARQVGQPARPAQVTIRFLPVTLRQPEPFRDAWPAVHVWAVAVREETPPPVVAEPLDWLLLTTVAVLTPADALERVDWYICVGQSLAGTRCSARSGSCRAPSRASPTTQVAVVTPNVLPSAVSIRGALSHHAM